jgi:hypothetical protein
MHKYQGLSNAVSSYVRMSLEANIRAVEHVGGCLAGHVMFTQERKNVSIAGKYWEYIQ